MLETAAAPVPMDDLHEEDALRAQLYRLLARLLARPASTKDLGHVAALEAGPGELGAAVGALARIAGKLKAPAIEREYHDLFIGLGRGELLPYASYYRTGFLHEKPLARLRDDMGRLGIERSPNVKEPEDHVAALMDMMAGLILGEYGEPDPDEERAFFETHIAPWAGHFFKDLEAARTAVFYAPVGTIGRLFMDIEEAAFAMR